MLFLAQNKIQTRKLEIYKQEIYLLPHSESSSVVTVEITWLLSDLAHFVFFCGHANWAVMKEYSGINSIFEKS